MISLFGLEPGEHRPHHLHDDERTYSETNCFVDCLIELVGAAGLVPEAMLGAAVAVDFEIDQWSFFKPGAEDLRRLYGIDVHEMQPYRRDLPGQIAERLAAGQSMLAEVDAFYLPDTATTSYRTEHVKTTVAAESIDLDAGTFRYFHNAGHFEVTGADFDGLFGVPPFAMALYVDLLRFDVEAPLTGESLSAEARVLLAEHLGRRPRDNPFERFRLRLSADLPGLLEADLSDYHAYAFATARMAGSSFELLATHVRWLFGPHAEPAATELDEIVGGTKMLLFRLARRRAFDTDAVVGGLGERWEAAMEGLDALVGR